MYMNLQYKSALDGINYLKKHDCIVIVGKFCCMFS